MSPDADPVRHFAFRIVPNLMGPLGLEVLYPLQTNLTWLSQLRL